MYFLYINEFSMILKKEEAQKAPELTPEAAEWIKVQQVTEDIYKRVQVGFRMENSNYIHPGTISPGEWKSIQYALEDLNRQLRATDFIVLETLEFDITKEINPHNIELNYVRRSQWRKEIKELNSLKSLVRD